MSDRFEVVVTEIKENDDEEVETFVNFFIALNGYKLCRMPA